MRKILSATGPGTVFALHASAYSYTWTVSTVGTVTAATIHLESFLCVL
jgi:hypothetical protein